MSVTALPSDYEIREAALAICATVPTLGATFVDPEFSLDPAGYAQLVDGHGMVAEDAGASPSGAGGLYESRWEIALHLFRGFNTAKPSGGKTRGKAFSETKSAVIVALHNAPRLNITPPSGVEIRHLGVEVVGGTVRQQSDLFSGYYALLSLTVVVKAC